MIIEDSESEDEDCCEICSASDDRVLRICRGCGLKYHHMCQVADEDGKVCNECFELDC